MGSHEYSWRCWGFHVCVLMLNLPLAVDSIPPGSAAMGARRVEGSLLGAFIADAATMPVHWIYDQRRVQQLVNEEHSSGAFLSKSHCPFYTHPTGRLSVYGEELWPLLESVAEEGGYNDTAFRTNFYRWASTYDSRLNHVSKVFLQRWESGEHEHTALEEDSQAHAITKAAILAPWYSKREGLFRHLDDAVAVHQGTEMARAAGRASAAILRAVIDGQDVRSAVAAAAADDDVPEQGKAIARRALGIADKLLQGGKGVNDGALQESFLRTVQQEGLSCALPGALVNSITAALVFDSYESAVIANLLAAGDSCSRAIFVGAVRGAAAVKEQGEVHTFIPDEWRQKAARFNEIRALATKLRRDVGAAREL